MLTLLFNVKLARTELYKEMKIVEKKWFFFSGLPQ